MLQAGLTNALFLHMCRMVGCVDGHKSKSGAVVVRTRRFVPVVVINITQNAFQKQKENLPIPGVEPGFAR